MTKKKKLKHDQAALIQSFSKNLLGLKFMQRASQQNQRVADGQGDGDEDDDDEVEQQLPALSSKTCKNLKGQRKIIINPSYQFCERLRFGRFSFKGMNLDIESIMHNTIDSNSSANTSEKRPAEDEDGDDD